MKLKTYILNLPKRLDRRKSIEKEFYGKDLFDTEILCPIIHEVPRISHWLSLQQSVVKAKEQQLPCFLFCEDDHIFTQAFDESKLAELINEVDAMEADLLLGGISWMESPLQINDRLFWVDKFNGFQFAIIFSRFFDRIIDFNKQGDDIITEIALSNLSKRIFVCYPFISIQKEFGYSDVTVKNNLDGYVSSHFEDVEKKLDIQNKVRKFYLNIADRMNHSNV